MLGARPVAVKLLPDHVTVSGTFVPSALAACLGRPVERLEQADQTALGAAYLAAAREPPAERGSLVVPHDAGGYLAEKYGRWREWLEVTLEPLRRQ